MVKQNSSRNVDRNMNEYKVRTSHGEPMHSSRSNPPTYNRVQVAQSSGCCSSKQTSHNHPPPPPPPPPPRRPVRARQTSPPEQTAHDRSHMKLDPPDPFYYRQGRVKKNPQRGRKPYQLQHGKNQVHVTRPMNDVRQTNINKNHQPHYSSAPAPSTTTTTKKSRCCTIL